MRGDQVVPVPGGKTAELLVRLAIEPGAFVGTDRLIDDLWAGTAMRRNTLQSKVTRLRRALGGASLVEGSDAGYRLCIEREDVDVFCVERDAAEASRTLAAGDHRRAADLSSAALGRYRGEPLGSAGDWADRHRTQLAETRMTLVETQLAARSALGDSVLGELEAGVAAYPYRERLWELLISALYGLGRQADALAAYRRARTRLADDLGIDPGPRLKELELQILNQDSGLDVTERDTPPGNLPALSTSL